MLESKIILPRHNAVFNARQGSLFFQHSYNYMSSDGVMLRSKDECFWHFFLSALGIAHTYEPDLPETNLRPDFGIANNFLLEICGPTGRYYFGKKSRNYLMKMQDKREEYIGAGYNIIEVYKQYQFVNGIPLTGSIIDLIQQYNFDFEKDSEMLSFIPEIDLEPALHISYRDKKYLEQLKELKFS